MTASKVWVRIYNGVVGAIVAIVLIVAWGIYNSQPTPGEERSVGGVAQVYSGGEWVLKGHTHAELTWTYLCDGCPNRVVLGLLKTNDELTRKLRVLEARVKVLEAPGD